MSVCEVNKNKACGMVLWMLKELWINTGKKLFITDECNVMIDGERRAHVWRIASEKWDLPRIAPPAGRRLD